MRKIINPIIGIVIAVTCLFGCGKQYYSGTVDTGFDNFPKNKITPKQALTLADPYLDISYVLRKNNREPELNIDVVKKPPIVNVTLHKDYYYVTKDNYYSKLVTSYLNYAVKVNKDTGAVIIPEE
ncbi:MAG: hypothetical protein KJ995_08170 [Candidatus Omnitrophica bacterium]|nr:hypothetical protein [Candidatus Omnitrophota bacterium]MBU1852362.1 hypothetical protein [Candidatus Omnitrophota bacterium]